jgi:hypothetical protein
VVRVGTWRAKQENEKALRTERTEGLWYETDALALERRGASASHEEGSGAEHEG